MPAPVFTSHAWGGARLPPEGSRKRGSTGARPEGASEKKTLIYNLLMLKLPIGTIDCRQVLATVLLRSVIGSGPTWWRWQ
jgi:hypothetical protein